MKFDTFYCQDGGFSKTSEPSIVSHRLLEFMGNKMEVDIVLGPETKGHSDGKFNVMFLDKTEYDEEVDEVDRKYFIHANLVDRVRLKWMFGEHHFQKHLEMVLRSYSSVYRCLCSCHVEGKSNLHIAMVSGYTTINFSANATSIAVRLRAAI